jgi:hypothetical protein
VGLRIEWDESIWKKCGMNKFDQNENNPEKWRDFLSTKSVQT